MFVYVDSDYKVHTEAADGLTAVETEVFDGKCRQFIEGYRFVPAGHTWTREDGRVFAGEMVAPHKDYSVLQTYQAIYEDMLAEFGETTTEE